MRQNLTRRSLFAAAAALPSAAQIAVPPTAPATAGEELTAARENIQANVAQLDKVPLPMSTEPATLFKA